MITLEGFPLHLGITMLRILIAFGFAFAAGTIAGIASGFNRALDLVITPLVNFFQGLPPILWAIPLLFLFGFGSVSPILAITAIIFPLVTVTVREQTRSLPVELDELLRVFAPRKSFFLRELLLPHISPALVSSAKLGLVLGLKASITAEFFTANDGIGFLIQTAFANGRIAELYGLGLVVLIIIYLLNRLLGLLFRVAVFDREKRRREESSVRGTAGFLPGQNGKKAPSRSIEFSHVNFSYPDSSGKAAEAIFENLSFRIPAGKIMVISGDSGTGKTTLLRLASRLRFPLSGDIAASPPFSFLFQDDRLLPWHTMAGNCALPVMASGIEKSLAYEQARRLLSIVGLEDAVDKFPDELSGGMKRRACLARCFCRAPKGLFLDEPFNGLQKKARRQLWMEFIRLWEEAPCPAIIVTHHPEEIPQGKHFVYFALSGRPARLNRMA